MRLLGILVAITEHSPTYDKKKYKRSFLPILKTTGNGTELNKKNFTGTAVVTVYGNVSVMYGLTMNKPRSFIIKTWKHA